MRAIRFFLTCSITLFSTQSAFAQSAADIFKEMDERKRASYGSVQNYTQKKQTLGMCSVEYFEKETTESTDGRGTIEYMRMVPISEIAQRDSSSSAIANASPEELDAIAAQLRMQGPQMETAMRSEMQEANIPGGIGQMMMNPPPNEPWLSASPDDMLGMYGTMLEGAAEGKRQDAARAAQAERDAATNPMTTMADRTRVVGRETVRNREAFLLLAEDLDYTQVEDGQSFTLNTMRLWVATDDYIPLKMSMEGVVTDGGESRELKIERESMEYRPVPGCPDLQEPFRTVMRIAGVLGPEEQAQMAEAQAQMAEMEQQLASMPTGQREMIMRQMGPQLEMFRNMASGNGIEFVSEVVAMRCNAGPPSQMDYAAMMPGNMMNGCGGIGFRDTATSNMPGNSGSSGDRSGSSAGSSGSNAGGSGSTEANDRLIGPINEALAKLGYDPGSTDGVATRETVIAITRFEAANGMPVTGKATPQLLGILQAKVAAQ